LTTVVFWNLAKNVGALPHLACLAAGYGADVILMAECPDGVPGTLAALNALDTGKYREADNAGSKVRALTRLGPRILTHRFTGLAGDVAIWSLRSEKMKPGGEVLLAGVHLPSKAGGLSAADQLAAAQEVVWEINEVEDRRGHRNTAVVGDFNMHPYDEGMTSVTGFHGLMTRRLAEQPDRVFRKQPRRRFYNPMWGLLGDRTPGPAGSYRWDSSVPHNTHWGMLDQLLLRKDLIGLLSELMVLEHDGTHALLGPDGFPDRTSCSDHLPIAFRLDV
jgi:hypothetical protein